jgi:hypothetical protein
VVAVPGAVVRPGLYRGTVAGMAWAVLRLRGRCMGVGELREELRRLGLDVDYGKLNRALIEYTGRLFSKTTVKGRTKYCALDSV